MRVLSREETEDRFREIGRDDHLRQYRRMMRRRRRRRVRRRLINTSNQVPRTPLQELQNQTPQTPLQEPRAPRTPLHELQSLRTPYVRRRGRRYAGNDENELIRIEDDEDRTCYICYTTMMQGETLETCLTCEYKFHRTCMQSWFMYNRNRTCPMCRSTFMQSPSRFTPPPPLIDLEDVNLLSPSFEVIDTSSPLSQSILE